jgi:hypothetical protein
MIDTQQQYIKLNIHSEISMIVVQAHSGRKINVHTHTHIYIHVYITPPATSALSKKNNNGEEDEKILFDPKNDSLKSYGRHFEIVIELKKFTISSF